MAPTFFDTLPPEAKQNVLRHLSDEPASSRWQSFVEMNDALSSVSSGHPLAETARRSFTSFVFRHGPDDGIVCSDGDFVLKWINQAGEFLTSLRSELSMQDSPRDALTLAIKDKCTALRCLDIRFVSGALFAESILRATSGRLKILSARGQHTRGIYYHCAGLQELKLDVPISDTRFLRTVGPTLKKLHIWPDSQERPGPLLYSRQTLERMRAFCPNLTDISVFVQQKHVSILADLLYSYGERLRFVNTKQLSVPMLERLVAECPNVKCSNFVVVENEIPGCGLLGTAVGKIELFISDAEGIVENLGSEMQSLTEVEHIVLSVFDDDGADAMQGVFMHEKPLLTWFDLVMLEGNGDDTLKELAKFCGTLRTFRYIGAIDDVKVFKELASNSPLLERVSIEHKICPETGDDVLATRADRITSIVSSFASSCPNLRDIEVSVDEGNALRIDEVADIVRCMRMKALLRPDWHRIRVHIEGEDYLD